MSGRATKYNLKIFLLLIFLFFVSSHTAHTSFSGKVTIGTATHTKLLQIEKEADTIRNHFELITPEKEMKWARLEPTPGKYRFDDAFNLINFARQNGGKIKGHTLIWVGSIPKFINDDIPTDNFKLLIDNFFINTLSSLRADDVIDYWDVVNEAIDEDEPMGLRNDIFLKKLGPNYIENAFHLAHSINPKLKLIYNDFAAEGMNKKSNLVFELLKDLIVKNVPISGVGLQMHLRLFTSESDPKKYDLYTYMKEPITIAEIEANFRRLSTLGIKIHVSEMDVAVNGMTGFTDNEKLKAQEEIYLKVSEICTRTPECTVFSVWGISYKNSWIRSDMPLLFDANYNMKPFTNKLFDVLH